MRRLGRHMIATIVILVASACNSDHRSDAPRQTRVRLWSVDMRGIARIDIEWRCAGVVAFWSDRDMLWRSNAGGRFIAISREQDSGAPLLVSRPEVIHVASSLSQLAQFGLERPQMSLVVSMRDGRVLRAVVGDRLPDGSGYYLSRPEANAVYAIDLSWLEAWRLSLVIPPQAARRCDVRSARA